MSRHMRPFLSLFIMIIAGLLMVPVGGQTVSSLSLTVYEDGYVLVNETISTANYTVVLEVPLLGQQVEGLVALDENGNLLPVEINNGNVTIYFGDATLVKLSYYTPDLTSKEGAVWTVSLESPVPVTISLPSNAVIVDLSDVPLEIRGNTLLMPPGDVSVSYLIPIGTKTTTGSPGGTETTTTTSQSQTTTTSTGGGGGSGSARWIGLVLALLIVGGAAYLLLGKKKTSETRSWSPEALERFRQKIDAMTDLNDDERDALLFLVENGGKAPQSRVRDALGLPKSTAWRMFKRLEEKGLVRVYKLGRENWVELVLE
ncbi:helix-turn-helix transcriptional regulator [Thermococcus waiotapuensis]|uniref:MarR family transcriptional regulator n=1 Tax=Thermococcus waiotapuensis TaxID=90909 RepID=A0AAE4NXD5_9EURY|nr:MarR family transcriptional regulator [Thermococcus waiotapuensis]MDV3104613.1 MarR family transcriptional regulator [Thermococcus waiotapuensis]